MKNEVRPRLLLRTQSPMLLRTLITVKSAPAKKGNFAGLVRALEIVIELADEAVGCGVGAGNFGVEIGGGLGGGDFGFGFAFANHLADAVTHGDVHVAVENEVVASGDGAVAGDYFGIGVGESDGDAEAVDHALRAAAVGDVDGGVADGAVEIAGHEHVRDGEVNQ